MDTRELSYHIPSAATSLPAPHRPTLLVADDDANVRAFVAATLCRNYLVLEASNGLEAIGLIALDRNPIKLVISDIEMPHLGGLDVAEWLGDRHPTMKLLLMSGRANDDTVSDRLGRTDVPFLSKPFRAALLTETVRTLISEPAEATETPTAGL